MGFAYFFLSFRRRLAVGDHRLQRLDRERQVLRDRLGRPDDEPELRGAGAVCVSAIFAASDCETASVTVASGLFEESPPGPFLS